MLPQFRTSSALRYLYATAAPTPLVPPTAAATTMIARNSTSPVSVLQPPISILPTTTPSSQMTLQGVSTPVVPLNMTSSIPEATTSSRPSSSLQPALNISSIPRAQSTSAIRGIVSSSVRSAINSSALLPEVVATSFQPTIPSSPPTFNSSAPLPSQSTLTIPALLPQNVSTSRGPDLVVGSPTSLPAILQGKTTTFSEVSQFRCPSPVPAILSGLCGTENMVIQDTDNSSALVPVSSASVSERRGPSVLPLPPSTTPIAPSTLISSSSRVGDVQNQPSGPPTAPIVSSSIPPLPETTVARIPSLVGGQPPTSPPGPKISGPEIVPSQVVSSSPSSRQIQPPIVIPGTTMTTRVSSGAATPSPLPNNSSRPPEPVQPSNPPAVQPSNPPAVQPSNPPAVQQPSSASTCSAHWAQCGGGAYTGPTCCESGLVCTYQNTWYSQCL